MPDVYDELKAMMRKLSSGDLSVMEEVEERIEGMNSSLKSFTGGEMPIDVMDCVLLEYMLLSRLHPFLLPDTWILAAQYIYKAVLTAYWMGRKDQWLEKNLEGVNF